jgi:DNA-binding NarL/FixJ family response regulator
MIRIAFADDHQIIIDGLRAILEHYPQPVEFVGDAYNGHQAIKLLEKTPVDILFLDIHMPQMDGMEAAREIKKRFPAVKIIALTMHDNGLYIKEMLSLGIDGYVLKNTGKEKLFLAIETVMTNNRFFDNRAMDSFINSFRTEAGGQEIKITKREMEVLKCIAQEQTTNEISEKLFISTYTVETHRKNLLSKLQAKNTAGLVKYAIKIGLV